MDMDSLRKALALEGSLHPKLVSHVFCAGACAKLTVAGVWWLNSV